MIEEKTINEEAGLPENWQPVDTEPINPGRPAGAPPPPNGMPSYYQGSLAPSIQHDATFVGTEYGTPGIAKVPLMPLGVQASPMSNAAIQSTAKLIAQQVVAATPATPSTGGLTSVGLAMPNIFVNPVTNSPLTSNGSLSVFLAPEFQNTVFAGPTGTQGTLALDGAGSATGLAPLTAGLVLNTVTSQANDFALMTVAVITGSSTSSSGPDASWTQIIGMPTLTGFAGLWWKNVPVAGPISGSASITVGAGSPAILGAIVTVKSAGGTPAVRQTNNSANVGVGNGGSTTVAFTSNTLANSTIFLVALMSPTGAPIPYAVSDSQGNQFIQLATVQNGIASGVKEQLVIYASATSTAAADTLTITNISGLSQTGSFYILEVTALAPPVFVPIFRTLVPQDIPGMQQGFLDLLHGGTGANLSLTGGAHQVLFQTAVGGAVTVAQPDYADLAGATQATKYRNIATVSRGLVAEYAAINLTAQQAAIGSTLLFNAPAFFSGGGGTYRISWVAKVTQAAVGAATSTLGGANGFQVIYTDQDDSVSVTTPAWWDGDNNGAAPTSASLNTTQTYVGGTLIINAIANQAVNYTFGYTNGGVTTPMQYNLHIRVEAL